jgi:hypothetical protein
MESHTYAGKNALPVRFVIEDNGLSCNSPTEETWGRRTCWPAVKRYEYTRQHPHVGIDKWVQF